MDRARDYEATLFYVCGLLLVELLMRRYEEAATLAGIEQATYDAEFWALVGG